MNDIYPTEIRQLYDKYELDTPLLQAAIIDAFEAGMTYVQNMYKNIEWELEKGE